MDIGTLGLVRLTSSSNPVGDAAQWLSQLAHSQIVTVIAVVAVAFLGFRMLTGYLPLRQTFRKVLGCFVLFGAGSIANGLIGITGSDFAAAPYALTEQMPLRETAAANDPAINPFDPYANQQSPKID